MCSTYTQFRNLGGLAYFYNSVLVLFGRAFQITAVINSSKQCLRTPGPYVGADVSTQDLGAAKDDAPCRHEASSSFGKQRGVGPMLC